MGRGEDEQLTAPGAGQFFGAQRSALKPSYRSLAYADKDGRVRFQWPEIMAQTEVWINRHGEAFALRDMDTDYLQALPGWIERNVLPKLARIEGRLMSRRFVRIEQLPLQRAIADELKRRGAEPERA